jgi:hypothetical protein
MRRLGPRPAIVRSYLQAFKQILDYEAVPPDPAHTHSDARIAAICVCDSSARYRLGNGVAPGVTAAGARAMINP